MIPIRRVLRKENTLVLSFLMFYEERKNMIFKVLSSVVYCITKNYACADYLYFPQTQLHVANKGFENITYNDISGIGIPELLMNIISCHGFVSDTKSAVILS